MAQVRIQDPEESHREGQPVSYMAWTVGTAVRSSTGPQFGTVEHVLQVPELDLC